MSSTGSILASQALTSIDLTKWIYRGPLNVRDWSRLYFTLKLVVYSIGPQENYTVDNFVKLDCLE